MNENAGKAKREVTGDEVRAVFRRAMRAQPHLTTTKGNVPWAEVEAGRFRKVEGGHENNNEIAAVVEYYDGDELVHRSAHVHLKKPYVEAVGEVQSI